MCTFFERPVSMGYEVEVFLSVIVKMQELSNIKNSCQVLLKKGVFKNRAKFTGRYLGRILFLLKWRKCFPVKISKYIRILILQNIREQLLLDCICIIIIVLHLTLVKI